MILQDPKVYPLEEFLAYIPADGLVLDKDNMPHIAKLFAAGGVICETFDELFTVLHFLAEETNLIELDKITLRKINGN